MTARVQLFITCLAEQFFPDVPEKMVAILEQLGVTVSFPPEQTCCGQPLFNSGFQGEARRLAARWLRTFSRSGDAIVAPSGSCVDMVRHHYPDLFPEGTPEHALALEVSARTFEFSQYLVHELKVTDLGAYFPHKVAYHASCHLLRGLGIRHEPKQLLGSVGGLELLPMDEEETCCGFGGAFSVIYPEVSRAMLERKIANVTAAGVDAVVACDPGCLMNISGWLRKHGSPVRAMHLVEVLASRGGER